MTTSVAARSPLGGPHSGIRNRPLAEFADVLRSEFCKLRSVRSTFWTLLAAFASNVVLAAVIAIVLPPRLSAHDKATLDSVRVSLAGLHLSQVAFGVLGILVITGEYSSGMIRASVAAVPRRRLLLSGKVLIFTAVGLIVGTLSTVCAYLVFQACLSDDALRRSLSDPGVLRAVIGAGLYLTVLGLFGLGLGAVLRGSAGAIATLFGVLFVPPILANVLPGSWQDAVGPYLPMNAGDSIYSLHREGALSAGAGFGVFSLYAAIALALGFFLIARRDA